jgi:hypothetical protein
VVDFTVNWFRSVSVVPAWIRVVVPSRVTTAVDRSGTSAADDPLPRTWVVLISWTSPVAVASNRSASRPPVRIVVTSAVT